MSKIKGISAALFAAVIMSTGPVVAKYTLTYVDTISAMFYFSTLAYISLTMTTVVHRLQNKEADKSSDTELTRKARIRTSIFFICVQTVPGLIWFSVIPHLQAIFAIMLKRTQPAIVLILSIFLKKRAVKVSELVVSLLAIGGVFLILQAPERSSSQIHTIVYPLGALACVIVWALQFIYSRQVFTPLTSFEGTRIGMGAYAIAISPIAILYGNPLSLLNQGVSVWIAVFYMGIILFGFGVAAVFYSLTILDPWVVSMILLTGPAAGAFAAWIILGETLTRIQIAGSIIVILSMVISTILSLPSRQISQD